MEVRPPISPRRARAFPKEIPEVCESKREAVDLLNFAGIVGFITFLALGGLSAFDGLVTIVVASAYLGCCFVSSNILSVLWKIPQYH
jgi:amino acid transporter